MRLLVVEDQIKLGNSLKKMLVAERFAVDLVYDGGEGYERAAVEAYDLIVMDLGLPTMDGVEICQQLRNEGIKTPIIMLTARDALADKIKGLNVGADDYVVKPFAFEELLARIRALLRRESDQVSEILEVEDLQLDPTTHRVTRGGKAVELTAKEYGLLEYLMHHQATIVPKQDLLEHVWGSEVDPFSNVIDVYIGYLRKKIDKPFKRKKPLIKTVKGLGYRIGV